jgi:nucleotide-binding universal stress UspA family protein
MPVAVVPDASGVAIGEMYDQLRNDAYARAQEVEQAFRDRMQREGIPGEWRQEEGNARDILSTHARYADLLLLGQDQPHHGPGLVEPAIFGTGGPVLIIPYAGRFATLGEKVLIAWNGSREAARAVRDALPILAAANQVTILAVDPEGEESAEKDVPSADLAGHLARHGVKAIAEHTVAGEIAPAEAMLNAAAETGADLLVMGAYGHSPLREMVLGGATRTLLHSMTLPVLMAH